MTAASFSVNRAESDGDPKVGALKKEYVILRIDKNITVLATAKPRGDEAAVR
jgi:hypothetical protein